MEGNFWLNVDLNQIQWLTCVWNKLQEMTKTNTKYCQN